MHIIFKHFISLQIDDLQSKAVTEKVQQALLKEKGVTNVTITGNKACIEYDHNTLGPRDVLKIVQVKKTAI